MGKISCVNNQLMVNGQIKSNIEGVYLLSGYDLKDSDKNGYFDSVSFDDIEAYYYKKTSSDPEIWTLSKLGSDSMSDFIPSDSGQESSGGYPPELLEIERERSEREKDSHSQLFSKDKVSFSDICGNESEEFVGLYPALRENNFIDKFQLNFQVSSTKMMNNLIRSKIDFSSSISEKSTEPIDSNGEKFVLNFNDSDFEYPEENIAIPSDIAKKFFSGR